MMNEKQNTQSQRDMTHLYPPGASRSHKKPARKPIRSPQTSHSNLNQSTTSAGEKIRQLGMQAGDTLQKMKSTEGLWFAPTKKVVKPENRFQRIMNTTQKVVKSPRTLTVTEIGLVVKNHAGPLKKSVKNYTDHKTIHSLEKDNETFKAKVANKKAKVHEFIQKVDARLEGGIYTEPGVTQDNYPAKFQQLAQIHQALEKLNTDFAALFNYNPSNLLVYNFSDHDLESLQNFVEKIEGSHNSLNTLNQEQLDCLVAFIEKVNSMNNLPQESKAELAQAENFMNNLYKYCQENDRPVNQVLCHPAGEREMSLQHEYLQAARSPQESKRTAMVSVAAQRQTPMVPKPKVMKYVAPHIFAMGVSLITMKTVEYLTLSGGYRSVSWQMTKLGAQLYNIWGKTPQQVGELQDQVDGLQEQMEEMQGEKEKKENKVMKTVQAVAVSLFLGAFGASKLGSWSQSLDTVRFIQWLATVKPESLPINQKAAQELISWAKKFCEFRNKS